MRIRYLVALLLAVFVQGCVSTSSVPELPETLGENGLLVGKIYMPGSYRWGNSQVTIDGQIHNASLRDGYLALSLAPGEHTLQNLRTQGWNEKVSRETSTSPFVPVKGGGSSGGYRAPTYYYTPGSTTYYTTLPINQKFKIEAGRITSVGMYVFLVDQNDPKKFFTIQLDNSKEMSYYLDTNYPALMGKLIDRNLVLAPGKYIDATKLPSLRQLIAAKEYGAGHFVPSRNLAVAYGNAGTIVALHLDKDKKDAPPKIDILDTGTLADINDVQLQGERLNFLTADGQILVLNNTTLSRQAIPYRVQPLHFRYFGEHGIVVVDNRRRLLFSNNDGQSWSTYEGVLLEKPSNASALTSTRDGVYLYSTDGVPKSISFHGYNPPTHVTVPTPVERGSIPAYTYSRLVATDAGLFIDYIGARDFHFKPAGQNDWQLRSTPVGKCERIVYEPSGRGLNISCDKIGYRSDDGGQNWHQLSGGA
jgi:hypothetical protein